MAIKVGIWIDRKKAVIVRITDEKEQIKTVESNIEKRTRLTGGSRTKTPYGPQDVAAEGRRERKYQHHLESYYKKVSEKIGKAKAVYIIGPGEAKLEFRKHLEKTTEYGPRIKGIEKAERMTERQLAALVRDYFAPK